MSITEEKIKEFREKFVVKVYDEAIVGQWDNVGLEGFIMAEDLESWLKSTLEQVVKETEKRVREEINPNKAYFKHKKGCTWGDSKKFAHIVPIGCHVKGVHFKKVL